MALPSKQRNYPQLLALDLPNLRSVIRQAFDWIFQLDANLEALSAKVDLPVNAPVAVAYIEDTHNQRDTIHAASAVPLGSTYYETDRGTTYQARMVDAAKAWVYCAGEMHGALAALPTGLGVNDTGFLFSENALFGHSLLWTGSAWSWKDPGDPSARLELFEVDPGLGWHLYDGTANVSYLNANGTTSTKTLPDLTSASNLAAFLVAGGTNGGPNAAVAPTVGGTLAVTSNVTGVTIPGSTGASAPGTSFPTGVVNVTVSGATSVATAAHTHVVNSHSHTIGAPTDPGHDHSLTGAITVGADGAPRDLVRRAFFRR